MATTGPTPFDDTVRPDDVRAEEALVDVAEDDDEAVPEDPGLPVEANEADVLEQREEVPVDDEDDLREE